MTDSKRIFVVLKDPAWDGLKPEKINLFQKSYSVDGGEQLVNEVLDYGLEVMSKGMVYDEEFKFVYWTYIPKGWFIDLWVDDDLLSDARAFTDFKMWLERVVTSWANSNKLSVKTERDKKGEYAIKFTLSLPPTAVI